MSSTLTRTSSFSAGAMLSPTSSGRCCAISADAARRRWALISNDAIAAAMRLSLTTRAATGTVPSVSLRHAIAGSSSRPRACCRCPMPMWSSPYPSNWRRSHSATSVCFTTSCFGLLPRHCSRSPPIHAIWALASVCSPCCTPGRRTWDIILTCTASFPPADWPSITPAGSRPDAAASSSRCACSAACSAASCSPSSSRAIGATNYASPASWLHYHTTRISLSARHACAEQEWVVYSKPPFGGPEHVLKYLARYTHRVAISNGRLLSLDNGQVRFRWRDSRHNNRSSVMTLDAVEFIRRFLLHVLPCRLRQDPPLRTARQPQPPPGPRPVQDPSPRHQRRTAAHC